MATWNEVKTLLKSQYPIMFEKEEVNYSVLGIEFTIAGQNRLQKLIISKIPTQGAGEWVQIASPIGKIPQNRLIYTLETVSKLAFGGIVKDGELYYLRESIQLVTISPKELIDVINTIVPVADALERDCLGSDEY